MSLLDRIFGKRPLALTPHYARDRRAAGANARPDGVFDAAPEPVIIDAEVVPDAEAEGVAPDLLTYLFEEPSAETAEDSDSSVSGSVPVNSTLDPRVRAVLARKLARLLPDLDADSQASMQRLAIRALERLARDQAVQVRSALATAIKDVACAPPNVCRMLARDVEESVAEPILHYCVTLTDQDLLAIVGGRPPSWVLEAIAKREKVSSQVSSAIVDTGDRGATGILLDNHGADISEHTLERIAEESARNTEWQASLARRPQLPKQVADKLTAFVDQSVLEVLKSRRDLDAATAREVVEVTRRRLEWLEDAVPNESPQDKARRLYKARMLTDEAVADALSWNEVDFVRAALALNSGIRIGIVDQILKSRSAKAITALAWRAKLSMRTAIQLQTRVASLTPRQLLYARGGTDYPMSPADMTNQLELFGVTRPSAARRR